LFQIICCRILKPASRSEREKVSAVSAACQTYATLPPKFLNAGVQSALSSFLISPDLPRALCSQSLRLMRR
jgi:hypothetical protein